MRAFVAFLAVPIVTILHATLLHAASPLPIPATGAYLGVWANPTSAHNQENAIELLEGPSGINRPSPQLLTSAITTGPISLNFLQLRQASFNPDNNLQGDIPITAACRSSHGHAIERPRTPTTSSPPATPPKTPTSPHQPKPSPNIRDRSCCAGSGNSISPVRNEWQPKPAATTTAPPLPNRSDSDFIGAWRKHIHELFQSAVGATNRGLSGWNTGHYTDGNANDPHGYYPGNAYVELRSASTVTSAPRAETFASDFGQFYTDFSSSQYGKPLMVGENASANESVYNAEVQPTYLNGILADLKSNLYPALKAYDYFDAPAQSAPNDWVLDTQGLAAFAAVATSATFTAESHARLRGQRRDILSRSTGPRLMGIRYGHGPEQCDTRLECRRFHRRSTPHQPERRSTDGQQHSSRDLLY